MRRTRHPSRKILDRFPQVRGNRKRVDSFRPAARTVSTPTRATKNCLKIGFTPSDRHAHCLWTALRNSQRNATNKLVSIQHIFSRDAAVDAIAPINTVNILPAIPVEVGYAHARPRFLEIDGNSFISFAEVQSGCYRSCGHLPGRKLIRRRVKVGGGSYLSSHDPRIVLGLGKRETIDWLGVEWPGGGTQHFRDLSIDRYCYRRRERKMEVVQRLVTRFTILLPPRVCTGAEGWILPSEI